MTQTPTPTPLPSQQAMSSGGLPLWTIIMAIGIIAMAATGYLFLRKQ